MVIYILLSSSVDPSSSILYFFSIKGGFPLSEKYFIVEVFRLISFELSCRINQLYNPIYLTAHNSKVEIHSLTDHANELELCHMLLEYIRLCLIYGFMRNKKVNYIL